MNGLCLEATESKVFSQTLHAMLGPAEDEHFAEIRLGEQIMQEVELGATFHIDYILVNTTSGIASFHGDTYRVIQEFANESADVGRESGGKE